MGCAVPPIGWAAITVVHLVATDCHGTKESDWATHSCTSSHRLSDVSWSVFSGNQIGWTKLRSRGGRQPCWSLLSTLSPPCQAPPEQRFLVVTWSRETAFAS